MRWISGILLGVAAVAGCLVVAGRAQDGEPAPAKPEEQPLRREAESTIDQGRLRELVADLGAEEYDRREAAFRELARLGEAARAALEEAAASEDVQVRVSAERLLRRLGKPEAGTERERRLSPDRGHERTAEEWLRDLEERGLRGMDWVKWRRLMDERLERMRREVEEMQREMERDARDAPAPGGMERHVVLRSNDESIDCRVDRQGKVTVTIERPGEDGQPESTTYEAEGADALRERHPEVWEKVKGILGADGGGFRLRIGPGLRDWPFGPRLRRWPTTPVPEPAPQPDAPRLGFYLGEVTPALRSHLGLAPEEGLLVQEVVPGTLAERLGLRRYDVVLRVGDRSVGSPEDVGEALGAMAEDAPVTVLVVRQGNRIELVEKR